MGDLEHYRQLVRELLTEYSQVDFGNPQLETELIFDTDRDGKASPTENRYQVIHVGWSNKRRIYSCVMHLDIKDGKIWIQHDGTEGGIANELVNSGTDRCANRGVPKQDIMLGFHSPFKRQFTEFAVS